jgi:transposase
LAELVRHGGQSTPTATLIHHQASNDRDRVLAEASGMLADPAAQESTGFATSLCPVLHATLANLSPGGFSKELNASDAVRLLNDFQPITPVERVRYDLAHELLDDVERLDVQLKGSHRRIKTAVKASGTSLTDLYGVGPILACELIGYTGDVSRFTNRDQFASYAGVAPIELSSGGRTVHRLSRRGNRLLNHAVHMVAICQIRQSDSEGRAYFERKVAQGKTKTEAIRSQKRHVSNAVYRQLLIDAQK